MSKSAPIIENTAILRLRPPSDRTVDGGYFKIEHNKADDSYKIRVEPENWLDNIDMVALYNWLKVELDMDSDY